MTFGVISITDFVEPISCAITEHRWLHIRGKAKQTADSSRHYTLTAVLLPLNATRVERESVEKTGYVGPG